MSVWGLPILTFLTFAVLEMGQNLERAVQKGFSDAGLLGIESAEVTLDSGT